MAGVFSVTKRILLKLEFCGTDFCGWQLQSESVESKSKRSLQSHVEQAVATALGRNGERFPVQGCGRTDSGVHALEYYCHFDLHRELEPRVQNLQKFAHSLNGILPRGIAVLAAYDVPFDFHALKSAATKVYEYRVLLRNESPAVMRDFMHWISAEIDAPPERRSFDYEKFLQGAKMLIGTHDFAAFASSGSEIKNTVRTVSKIEIFREKFPHHNSEGDFLRIRFWGNGFLKQMVRNMAGMLFDVATGKRELQNLSDLLHVEATARKDAGMCAPPQGLFLSRVIYDHPANPFADIPLYADDHVAAHEVLSI